jgi:methionyl-tRNA formyltransferase
VTIRPRVVFLGTPDVAVPTLERLVGIAHVPLVVTQPDRPVGRSKKPQPPPVKEAAVALGIEVAQPARSAETAAILEHHGPFDVAVLVAFGQLIRPAALAIPRRGFLNVHFSMLPRWRGAAPVQRALMAGDPRVGVSVMELEEGLDTGPVLAVRSSAVGAGEDAGTVLDRLATAGAGLLGSVLMSHVFGRVVAVRQPDDGITVADKITSADRPIDWTAPAERIVNQIRGLAPRPGATALFEGMPMKILRAEVGRGTLEPGRVGPDASVGAGQGLVHLLTVQPAGKQPMPAAAWLRGLHTSHPSFELTTDD